MLTSANGLPGVSKSYNGVAYYEYTSHTLTPDAPTNRVRITVVETLNNEAPNGNNVIFSLSELRIYDKDGITVPYIASSNADHNTLSGFSDGDGLSALSDGNYKSYFHSMWSSQNAVSEYHYLELELERSLDAFVIEWATRLGEPKNSPTLVGITLGTDYTPSAVAGEFELGDVVVDEEELAAKNQLFVLRSNALKRFTTDDGYTYTGRGPLFMQSAEEGDVVASSAHIMQLVPAGDGTYLVYWPLSGKFLENNASNFYGSNGWQYSTDKFADAACVRITADGNGDFELQYDGDSPIGAVTLYVGADLRDNNPKMKTFDFEQKQALELGDYTQGFGLPIAFNWTIYKAGLDESTVSDLMVTIPQLAENYLNATINEANRNLAAYGNHDGYCNGEDDDLRQLLSTVRQSIPSMDDVADVLSAERDIYFALSNYMSVGLLKYEVQANELMYNSKFSQPPYVEGSYPEIARTILADVLATIADAKGYAGIYSADQYISLYSKVERDIELFLATKAGGANDAKEWSVSLTDADGLPGTYYSNYYEYTSQLLIPSAPANDIRVTVKSTINNATANGYVFFALSELRIYDENGVEVPYTATSNACHNTITGETDGGGLAALSDGSNNTFFHSLWKSNGAVRENHYIELDLERSVNAFVIEWASRYSNTVNAPTAVEITFGDGNASPGNGSEFVLGDAVVAEEELAAKNQLFVLRGNALKSFTTADGYTYTGSGPLFMQFAEEGDTEASVAHVMQLIPAGGGRYIVYWPAVGRYLENSSSQFNGVNGWQYSTNTFANAAYVKFVAVENGCFEMQYDGENSSGPVALYVAAELRDGVNSKMKTFDLYHKQALEMGDYTQGFALPAAFNWSLYKAELDATTVEGLMITVPQLAQSYLNAIISEASNNLSAYGNHGGYCSGEDENLRLLLSTVRQSIPSMDDVADVTSAEESIFFAMSNYMAAGLSKYAAEVNSLLMNSTFSQPPYIAGTYPESSRAILTSLLTTSAGAKEKAGVYSASQYVTIYGQIERDIEQFRATWIEDDGESGGGKDEEETPDEEPVEDGELVFVYLSNGDVDAYPLASLDGGYYVEKGTLYFHLASGDVRYYTAEEYDSCSMVMPALPAMTSFKFNNKYNPTLNVDVVCDSVTNDINLTVNAIGKWLTASFQLSDDRAVAYVDTVLQVSKETVQSFAKSVYYKVTYPGYNIIKNIKVQDEIWTTPSVNGGVTEVNLTADMLSTNKPSSSSNEVLGNLLDGSPATIFHSTWGSANNATANVDTYIDIALPEALENIQLYYKCRPQRGYNPLVWEVYASNDGYNWTLVRTLDYQADNMPTGGTGQEYTSPTIALGGKYSYLRILQTSGEYAKNHFVLSELRVYNVVEASDEEPVKIQDALYENRRVPFGNVYKVTVDWLTDRIAAVPRIDIDIDGGDFVTSKSYYLNANFRITGNGVYDDFEDSVQIKGRGNTSWSYSKKPYRLKFAQKVKPFGLTKGKSWVLLANAQNGSLMANAIAMKIGQMAGAKYTNHIIPVELYMNGQYMGSYMFTEKVGMANNSVDIDEESGYLVELDTYTDETIYRTGFYNLPVKVSEPDLDELDAETAGARIAAIKKDSKDMQAAVASGEGLESVLDVDATARFFLANDLVLNQEINHPKSTYYFKDESAPNGKITFGPLWDFDWGFDYENGKSYCYSGTTSSVIKTSMEAYTFWQDMTEIEIFKKHYYKVWKEFVDKGAVTELQDYIDSYYNFAKTSFQNNANEWGYYNGFREDDRDRAKQWVANRANYIYNNLDVYDIEDLIYTLPGDVNMNNQLTVHDAALVTSYLNGVEYKRFSKTKADANADGYVDLADVEHIAAEVMMADAPSAMYALGTPLAAGELYGNDFVLALGEEGIMSLNVLSYSGEDYTALQFDIRVPDDVFIDDIVAGDALASHNFTYEMLDMNTYRVVIYSDYSERFNQSGDDVIVNIISSTMSVVGEDARAFKISNIYAVNDSNDEVRFDDISVTFSQATGLDGLYATYSVEGGECLTVTALEAQEIAVYSVDGRLVCKRNVVEGTTRIQLPAGMYVVNGVKVLVY